MNKKAHRHFYFNLENLNSVKIYGWQFKTNWEIGNMDRKSQHWIPSPIHPVYLLLSWKMNKNSQWVEYNIYIYKKKKNLA